MHSHRLSFGWFLRFAIILFCATFLLTVGLVRAAQAGDYGPPPNGQFRACQVAVDPPVLGPTVTVANLIVAGHPVAFSASKVYDVPNGAHEVVFDLPAAKIPPGKQAATIDATWNIGTGVLHISGTIDCNDPPLGPAAANCDGFIVPAPAALPVTAVVKLGVVTFPARVVTSDGTKATFPWTAAQKAILAIPGPHPWTVTATWAVGAGSTTSGSVTCVQIPPTTTTTTKPPVTTTTTAKPPVVPHDTDHPVPPAAVTPKPECPNGTDANGDCLPFTGSS